MLYIGTERRKSTNLKDHLIIGNGEDLSKGALRTPEIVVVIEVAGVIVDIKDGEPQALRVTISWRS